MREDEFGNRAWSSRAPRSLALAAAGVALLLGGCGPAQDEAARLGRSSIVKEIEPLEANRVDADEFRGVPRGSASRAFLKYWAALQQKRWRSATLTYEPGLRRFIGARTIASALRRQVVTFVAHKPHVLGQRKNRRGRTIVSYVVRDPRGVAKWEWTSWGRIRGRWRIFYDKLLNAALRVDAARSTQERTDPSARRLSKRARTAGRRAARQQRRYLRWRRESRR